MALTDASMTSLRVLRAVAEHGSLSSAAEVLGYSQSAVSRHVGALERAAGRRLVDRGPRGARLTAAGQAVLGHVLGALAGIDAADEALRARPSAADVVRLGWFATAGVGIVPRVVAALPTISPGTVLRSREGTTPSLVRAVRSGSLDLALVSSSPPYRPPDGEDPPLVVDVLAERSLRLAVPSTHPLAGRTDGVDLDELEGLAWIGGPGVRTLGVWPGLAGRARVAHTARDWLAKLNLVASGAGITTIPWALVSEVPAGVSVVDVRDGPQERRRVILVRRERGMTLSVAAVARAVQDAVDATGASPVRQEELTSRLSGVTSRSTTAEWIPTDVSRM